MVRTTVSIGKHRAHEALADQSTEHVRSLEGFRGWWHTFIKAAAAADAAQAPDKILLAGNNFIVVIFVRI